MRKLIILLLLIAGACYGQQNATFNNLDIRNTTKLRGVIYPFGAVATSPINPAVHEVLMVNNSTFATCRMDFAEFADSIANAIGSLWYANGDTIYTDYNVRIDSSFSARYNRTWFGNNDPYQGDENFGAWVVHGDTNARFYATVFSDNTSNVTMKANIDGVGSAGFEAQIDGDLGQPPHSWMVGALGANTTTFEAYPTYAGIYSDSVSIDANHITLDGSLTVTGQVSYDFKHLVTYLTAGSYTPNVSQNVAFKLAPAMSTSENDGLTFAGDSITIITAGDYTLEMGAVLQGSNGDDFKFTVRKNGTEFTTGNAVVTTTGAGNYQSFTWFYYFVGLQTGDDISFYVTNESSNNDPTFRAFKIFIRKEME